MAELIIADGSEFELTIKLGDSDIFRESADSVFIEIARILRHTATKIEQGQTEMTLYDISGNSIGSCQVIDT
jgi:hypothetical protein